MKKLLLNFQMSPMDFEQGKELLRLICDIEEKPRTDVIVMLTYRYDMELSSEVIDMVRKKFPDTITYKTQRNGEGWPAGPNAMMGDSFMHAVMLARRDILNIDGVFFMECDCIPLKKEWLNEIIAEWKDTLASQKMALGPWLEVGDAGLRHLNGNCILSPSIWRSVRGIFHSPSNVGWDAYHAQGILANAKPSRLIFSDYRLGTPDNPWKGDAYLFKEKSYGAKKNPLYGEKLQPAWLHGVKVIAGIKAVRKKLLTSG